MPTLFTSLSIAGSLPAFLFTKVKFSGILLNFTKYFPLDKPENIYFPSGNFKLVVFRIPLAGESVISSDGVHASVNDIYYEVHQEPVKSVKPLPKTIPIRFAEKCVNLFS